MQLNNSTIYAFNTPREARYLAVKFPASGGAGERLVSIYAAREDSDTVEENHNHVLALVDVVEQASMDQRMVTMTAEKMASELASAGRVALYGIYFDTDKTDVKPESEPR